MNNQRNHYLRLKEDFFKQDKMAILENSKNGFLYSNILLKIYLLSMKNDGKLLLADEVPFTSEMIAHLTGHKEAIVEQALVRFKELDLVKENEDKSLSMTNFQLFHESIYIKSEKKRAYRERKENGQNEELVLPLSTDCPPDVAEKSLSCLPDGTEESLPSPPKVTDKSQSSPTKIPNESTSSTLDDTDQSNPNDVFVKSLSTDEDSEVTEVVEQPYSYSPPRSKKSGDEIPTFSKGKRLKPPKNSTVKK